ncbi:transcription factor IIA, alpha/beta subunit-domain-containing protein [Mycena sp. CBHHK59/15]|nr:transcription factor IIA, alpha/beta subunit-domain-containing protein [Mycena sp. CBHHK59/15]
MSNILVPLLYRTVIDDVIAIMKAEFQEAGLAEDVLVELQQRWEDKVIASRVADFEPPQLASGAATPMMPQYHPFLWPLGLPVSPPTFPPESATRSMPGPAQLTEEILPFHPGFPPYIPQIDGSPDNSTDDVNSKYPTHPPHQPLAEPATSPESINSDLDDSDTDEEDAEDSVGGNLNTMFCNFEKVSRNKAKWKCVLKNGVIHANGKDYLFSRCTGGFDWE